MCLGVWVSVGVWVCGGVFGRVGMCTAPKEYLGDVDGHAPRLGNSQKTLEDVLEDVHAAYGILRRCEF